MTSMARCVSNDRLRQMLPADSWNLTGALLERSSDALANLVEPGGFLIVSGFMETETAVLPALEQLLSTAQVDREDEWLCAVLKKAS